MLVERFLMEGLIHSLCVGECLWLCGFSCMSPTCALTFTASFKAVHRSKRGSESDTSTITTLAQYCIFMILRYHLAQPLQSQNGPFLGKGACTVFTDIYMWLYRQSSVLCAVQQTKTKSRLIPLILEVNLFRTQTKPKTYTISKQPNIQSC